MITSSARHLNFHNFSLQWIIAKPQTCSFFGAVGKDKYSETLEKKATEAGVRVKYQFDDKHPTGEKTFSRKRKQYAIYELFVFIHF